MNGDRTVADPKTCAHENFEALVIVNRLVDTGRFQMEVKVYCKDCACPMLFPTSIGIGVDLAGVARNVTGTELRVALEPWIDAPRGIE